jgi:hypothetical protein
MEEGATTAQASQGKESTGARSVFIWKTLPSEKRRNQRDQSVQRFR